MSKTLTAQPLVQDLPADTLAPWGLEAVQVTPLSERIHRTLRVDTTDGERFVLRLYGPGTYDAAEILSELQWQHALAQEAGLRVPEAVPTTSDELVATLPSEDGPSRHAVLLRWLKGEVCDDLPGPDAWRRFGGFMARLHRHGAQFTPPQGFRRRRYDANTLAGAPGRPVPEVEGGPLSAEDHELLATLAERLRPEIEALGEGSDAFGLIHGDLQISNQILHQGEVGALDFVDCGFGHHLFDIASALLPAWEGPGAEERKQAFLRGYRRVRPLPAVQEELLETFALARALSVMRFYLESWDDPAVRAFGETLVPHLLGQIRRVLAGGASSASAVEDLIAEMGRKGIRAWAEDGRLRFKAPRGAMTDDLRGRLREHKQAVLDFLTAAQDPRPSAGPPIVPVPRTDPMPTSFGQQRFWILDQIDPGSASYHIAQGVRLRGPLDTNVLARTLFEILSRHEVLRTTFIAEEGQEPRQHITPLARLVQSPPAGAPRTERNLFEREAGEAGGRGRGEGAGGASASYEHRPQEHLRAGSEQGEPSPQAAKQGTWHLPKQGTWHLPEIDLTTLDAELRQEVARTLGVKEARRPFQLDKGPLARFTLVRLDSEEHWLLLTLHHIVSDGWSNGILIRELKALYQAFRAGRPSPLPPLPLQYADFAAWQRGWLQGEVLDKQLTFWKEQLAGAPSHLEMPTDRPRPRIQSDRGAELPLPLAPGVGEALEVFSRTQGATLFMTLLASFALLLERHSSQRDIVVGSPIANRNRREIEGLIGFFVNTLVLRTKVHESHTFEQMVAQVKQTTLQAYEHQDLPFENVVEALEVERNPSYTPVFQVLFTLQNAPSPSVELEDLTLDYVDPPRSSAAFDLSFTFRQKASGLEGALTFNTDLFDTTRMGRLLHHYGHLLKTVVEQSDVPLERVSMLPAAEQHQLLYTWNDRPALPTEEVTGIHHLVAQRAAEHPDAIAIVDEDRRATYGELLTASRRLAHHLLDLGVGHDRIAAICLDRSLDLLTAVLAVLEAGGAYVTLDPLYPPRRLAFMLEDTAAPVLISRRQIVDGLGELTTQTLCLDEEQAAIDRRPDTPTGVAIDPDQLAYVVYTSGSTGRPKGVMVSHGALVRSFLAWREDYDLQPVTDHHLQMASPSFDVFAGDWTRALCSGGRLVLCPWETLLEPPMLYDLLEQEEVTVAEFVPAIMRGLMGHCQEKGERLHHLRMVAVGSDAWHLPEHNTLRTLLPPGCRLVDSYGVAEVTIDSTYFETTSLRMPRDRPVPIGRPFAGNRVQLLDPRGELAPTGSYAELYLAGESLAHGYLGRPALTAQRFLPDPFAPLPGARRYRTGDRARHLPDGNVEFAGRLDHQVKIRGFRIELGEVESELGRNDAVREAAAIVREDRPGDRRLVAYVVLEQDTEVQASELRAFLKDGLPGYMVPAHIVFLDSIPLNPNGKVDKKALPAPDATLEDDDSFVAPETPTEIELAEIWQQLLHLDRIGIYDNFFDLGGNSLMATQLMSRVRRAFSVELSLAVFFEGSTVADLARSIEVARRVIEDTHREHATDDEDREEGEL